MTGLRQHWLTNVARAFDAFIYHGTDPGPNFIFGDLADPKNLVKSALYNVEIAIADCILVSKDQTWVSSPQCIATSIDETMTDLQAVHRMEQEQIHHHSTLLYNDRPHRYVRERGGACYRRLFGMC